MLLEEGRESHCVITGLNSLHSTIQSPIAGEEISEGAFYGIKGRTLLIALTLPFLQVVGSPEVLLRLRGVDGMDGAPEINL